MRGWGGPKHRRAIVLALTAAGLTAVGLPGLPRAQALVPASVEARLTAGDSDDNFGPATDLPGPLSRGQPRAGPTTVPPVRLELTLNGI